VLQILLEGPIIFPFVSFSKELSKEIYTFIISYTTFPPFGGNVLFLYNTQNVTICLYTAT